jgi:hypothetical protein
MTGYRRPVNALDSNAVPTAVMNLENHFRRPSAASNQALQRGTIHAIILAFCLALFRQPLDPHRMYLA